MGLSRVVVKVELPPVQERIARLGVPLRGVNGSFL